jgi:hypothetical protein
LSEDKLSLSVPGFELRIFQPIAWLLCRLPYRGFWETVQWGMFGPKADEETGSCRMVRVEEFHDLYFWTVINRVFLSRVMEYVLQGTFCHYPLTYPQVFLLPSVADKFLYTLLTI